MSINVAPEFRTCKICGQTLPFGMFTKHSACKYGRSHRCLKCNSAYYRKYRPKYREENRDCLNEQTRRSYEKHKANYAERSRLRARQWYKDNKPHVLERIRLDRHPNPGKYRVRSAKHYAALRQAMPTWLTAAQAKEIEAIYNICPSGHEVDHIVPLKGRNVSGLHVPWNLQIIPMHENRRKSNKF